MVYFYSRTCNRKDAIRSIEDSVIRYPERFPDSIVNGLRLRSDNEDQNISSYFKEHTNAMRFIQGFIEKSIPEQYGDIEPFHIFLKIDYIWIREIRDLSEGTKVIEGAFNDYNKTGSHSFIEHLVPKVFRKGYLNDSKFRLSYGQKLENKRNKKRERNKMKWNEEKIREAI